MSKKMKLVIKCETCGKYIELESNQVGHQIHMNNIQNNNFSISEINIENDGDLEDITDIDDVKTTLTSVRINCNNCGDYIVLEDWSE